MRGHQGHPDTDAHARAGDGEDRGRAGEIASRGDESFRALIEQAPDAIGVFREGVHLYVNPRLAALLGRSVDEMMHKRLEELIHPDDHALFRDRGQRRNRGEKLAPAEYRLLRSDGALVYAEITSINVEYAGGPAVLCILRDVTEKRELQRRLVQADRLASVGMLAGGIAHEINNPLAYALTNLEILARFRLPALQALATTDEQRAAIAQIVDGIEDARHGAVRVRKIVRDVKTFAREGPDDGAPVHVATVLDAALDLAKHEIEKRGSLVREVGPLPPVLAGESRLGQVLLNLLMNAAQALPDRPGNEVRVRGRAEAGEVVIEVSDTGDGLPPELLARVFDPFFTTGAAGRGTGLGLFVCHGIVASFGGSLAIESAVGVGTTVRLRIPVAPSPVEVDPAPAVTPAPTSRRGRILLIDDEPSLTRALVAALDDEHDVVTSPSGSDALALLARDTRFDVVLCDLMMPGTSGVDVWQAVSRRSADLAGRFVFVTGGAYSAEVVSFLEAGHPYVEKPFDLVHLRALLSARVAGEGAVVIG